MVFYVNEAYICQSAFRFCLSSYDFSLQDPFSLQFPRKHVPCSRYLGDGGGLKKFKILQMN